MEPLIKVDDLHKIYNPGENEVRALDGVSLTINRGELVAIVGHSGSGKSTFLRSLNLLETPTEGKILFEGNDITDPKSNVNLYRQKIGMVFQHFNLFANKTILENMTLAPIKVLGKSKQEAEEEAMRLLERVGLQEKAAAYPAQLSGGQKRRVAIAGVLAMDPQVLILDEPTAGLDPKGRDEILDQIAFLHEERKITVILVSHSMEDIARYVERILVMNKGEKRFDGVPREVFSHYRELETMGLAAPQITYIMHELREKGLMADTSAITVEEAKKSILEALEKRKL